MVISRERLYAEYAAYHRDPRNRRAHAFGIPLIVLGLLGVFHLIPLRVSPVDPAAAAAIAVLLYYAALDAAGAAVCAVAFALLYAVARVLPWEADTAAFIIGWGFQLVGHRLEGNKPKFLENLVYLLIGPLYFFREAAGALIGSKQAA